MKILTAEFLNVVEKNPNTFQFKQLRVKLYILPKNSQT